MSNITQYKEKAFEIVPINAIDEYKKYYPTISELAKIDLTKTKIEMVKIMAKYLSISSKVKNLNDTWYELIIEHLNQNCKNLELSEIDYIFKNGIMGTLGNNYQEIAIDTITGENGWIETYYKKIRIYRPEPKIEEIETKTSGKEITIDEFYKRNPSYKARLRILEIAQKNEITFDLINEFYNDVEFVEKTKQEIIASIPKMIEEYNSLCDKYEANNNIVTAIEIRKKLANLNKILVNADGTERNEEQIILNIFRDMIKGTKLNNYTQIINAK